MLHKEFWGLIFLAFVGWIFLTSDPQARIARTCRPIMWTGNIGVSLTAFASPSGAESVQKWANKLDYGCRYTVWRLIYQDDYNKFIQAQHDSNGTDPGMGQSSAADPADSAPATSSASRNKR